VTYRPLASLTGDEAAVLSSDVPVQVQIYRQLRSEIEDGLWIGRDDFPGERELAEQFSVSVITSRAALERLARDGLVQRARGKRTRATHVPDPAREDAIDLFPDDSTPFGFQLVRSGVDTAPAHACEVFGLPAGSQLWQAIRVVSLDGAVHSVTHNAQLPAMGLRHAPADLEERPMVAILRAEGVSVARIRRTVQAANPPPLAARYLGLSLDSPALMVVLVMEDADGHVVEWMRAFAHPSRGLGEEVMDTADGGWRPAR
jgi:GntR family transcriptional regulator